MATKNWDKQGMRDELFRKLADSVELTDQLRKVKVELWEKVFEMGFHSGWKAGQDRITEMDVEKEKEEEARARANHHRL